jgi:hypothetical protein
MFGGIGKNLRADVRPCSGSRWLEEIEDQSFKKCVFLFALNLLGKLQTTVGTEFLEGFTAPVGILVQDIDLDDIGKIEELPLPWISAEIIHGNQVAVLFHLDDLLQQGRGRPDVFENFDSAVRRRQGPGTIFENQLLGEIEKDFCRAVEMTAISYSMSTSTQTGQWSEGLSMARSS